MPPVPSDVRCSRLALKQFGVFSTHQALAEGLTTSSLYRRVSSGQLQKVLPGVFRSAGVVDSFETRAFASLLWAGEGCALSHETAGALWGFDGCENHGIHLLCSARRRSPADWLTLHQGALLSKERVKLGRFFATSASRTLLDLAASMDRTSLEVVLESALRKRATSVERLDRFLAQRGTSGRNGASNLHALLAERESGYRPTDSALEVRVQRLLRSAGITGFEVRPLLRLEDGSLVEPDLFFRAQRVAIEAHGYRYHSGRSAWEKDIERKVRLEANGVTVLEVTHQMVQKDPGGFIDRVRKSLGILPLDGFTPSRRAFDRAEG